MEEILNGVDDNCDSLIDEGYNQSDLDGDGLIDYEDISCSWYRFQ